MTSDGHTTASSRPRLADRGSRLWQRARSDPASGAFLLLRIGYAVLPLWMGIDKFLNALTDWPGYLAPWIVALLPFTAATAMHVVGVIEIVAGISVALAPRYAAWLVTAWLAGIIINLLTYSGFYDVALRDFGLLIGALALALLAARPDHAEHLDHLDHADHAGQADDSERAGSGDPADLGDSAHPRIG